MPQSRLTCGGGRMRANGEWVFVRSMSGRLRLWSESDPSFEPVEDGDATRKLRELRDESGEIFVEFWDYDRHEWRNGFSKPAPLPAED